MNRGLELSNSADPLEPSERVKIFDIRLGETDTFSIDFPGDRFVKGGSGELSRDSSTGDPVIRLHDSNGVEDSVISYDGYGNFVPTADSTSISTDKLIERIGDHILRLCDPNST